MEHRRANVLITRPFSSLHNALPLLPRERFNVCPCPTINIQSVGQSSSVDDVLRQIPTFDFAIFTSQIAVIKTIKYLHDLGIGLEQLNRIYVCAVGPITAERLNRFGIKAKIVPNKYTAQALADLFPVMHTHAPKVLFPRGNMSSSVLADELTRKGYRLISPVIYVTEPRRKLEAEARQLIDSERADCVAFTSPSSVVALKSLIGEDKFKALSERATFAAIGPVTADACVKAGARVTIQPEDYTLRALAQGIARHFGSEQRHIALTR